jgi:hypothetical protein
LLTTKTKVKTLANKEEKTPITTPKSTLTIFNFSIYQL